MSDAEILLFTLGYREIEDDGLKFYEVAVLDGGDGRVLASFPVTGPLDDERKRKISKMLFEFIRECLQVPLEAIRIGGQPSA